MTSQTGAEDLGPMLLLPTGGPRGWGKAEGRKETLEGIFMCALGSVQKHLHTGAGVSYGCSQNPGLGRAWPRSSEMHHPDNSVQTWPPGVQRDPLWSLSISPSVPLSAQADGCIHEFANAGRLDVHLTHRHLALTAPHSTSSAHWSIISQSL